MLLDSGRRIGNAFMRREGRRRPQLGKQFVQKVVYLWKVSHVFLKENRICADLYKKQSNYQRESPWVDEEKHPLRVDPTPRLDQTPS